MTRRIAAAMGAVLLAGCGAQDDWSDAVRIGDAGVHNDALTLVTPEERLAMAPDGSGAFVWERRLESGSEIWASRVTGSGWSPAQRIQSSDALRYAVQPDVGVDDRGDGFASWVEMDGTQTRLLVSRLSAATGWQAPAVFDQRAARFQLDHYDQHLAVEPGGHAVLAWQDARTIRASYHLEGTGWSSPEAIDMAPPNGSVGRPEIGLRGTFALVTWFESLDLLPRPVLGVDSRALDLASGRWRPGLAPAASRPLIDARGGVLMVAADVGFFSTGTYGHRFEPATGWQARELLQPSPSFLAPSPGTAGNAEGEALALLGSTSGDHLLARRFAPLQGWGPEEAIDSPGHSGLAQAHAGAVDDSGNAFALWSGEDGLWLSTAAPLGRWISRRVPGAQGPLYDPGCPVATRPDGRVPRVAIDARGGATVTWPRADCSRATFWAQGRRPGTL